MKIFFFKTLFFFSFFFTGVFANLSFFVEITNVEFSPFVSNSYYKSVKLPYSPKKDYPQLKYIDTVLYRVFFYYPQNLNQDLFLYAPSLIAPGVKIYVNQSRVKDIFYKKKKDSIDYLFRPKLFHLPQRVLCQGTNTVKFELRYLKNYNGNIGKKIIIGTEDRTVRQAYIDLISTGDIQMLLMFFLIFAMLIFAVLSFSVKKHKIYLIAFFTLLQFFFMAFIHFINTDLNFLQQRKIFITVGELGNTFLLFFFTVLFRIEDKKISKILHIICGTFLIFGLFLLDYKMLFLHYMIFNIIYFVSAVVLFIVSYKEPGKRFYEFSVFYILFLFIFLISFSLFGDMIIHSDMYSFIPIVLTVIYFIFIGVNESIVRIKESVDAKVTIKYIAKLNEEIKIASAIQKKFLPREKIVHSFFKIDFLFIPSEDLAGDYFDIFEKDKHHIYIISTDVCGHGVVPALYSGMLKNIFVTGLRHNIKPSQLIYKIRTEILPNFQDDMFLTMAIFLFDNISHTVTFSNAGHPPLMHYIHEKNNVKIYEKPSAPVASAFKNFVYEEQTVFFQKGDRFLIYTDGLYEFHLKNSEDQFGLEELQRLFYKTVFQKKSLNFMIKKIQAFHGSKSFDDDISAVCIFI